MASKCEQRVWKASLGVLEPSARQTVRRGIYDEMCMSPTVYRVTFDGVVILSGVHVTNDSARGTIIVPEGTTLVRLGGSLVNVLYWSWGKICQSFQL